MKPKIVLKNVHTFRGTEGYGLNADVWINDVKCLFVIDAADGGMYSYTRYHTTDAKKQKAIDESIAALEKYIADLPSEPLVINGENIMGRDGEQLMWKPDMDTIINDAYVAQEEQKLRRKVQNAIEKIQTEAIVFGLPGKEGFSYGKYGVPLASIDTPTLQRGLDKIIDMYCVEGVVILNTNLKQLGLIAPNGKTVPQK